MKNKQIFFMLLLSASFLLGACSTKGHEEKMKTQKEAEDDFDCCRLKRCSYIMYTVYGSSKS